jgi:4-hydroxy-tetrahydrodipicolinate synthase
MPTFSGVLTAMVTPFAGDGSVDLGAARSLARHLVDSGSHGLVVAGTTGESPTLSDDEKLALTKAVIDEVGEAATVITGTGSNDTHHSVELTKAACRLGVDGVLVVTPYYNKPNPAGLRAHFEEVSKAAGQTPIIVYNIPSRCVINMPPEFLEGLAADLDNVVAVKQANNDDLGPIPGLEVLAGNDEIFLKTLEVGGTGGILVASHLVGAEMRAMFEAHEAGDAARAEELHGELSPIYEALTITANPIPVKAGLEMLGVIDGRLRLPMVPASEEERSVVRTALERHGLLVAGGTA